MEAFKKFLLTIIGRDAGENYAQLLTFAYVFALSLIAAFTLVSHAITNHISDTQIEREEILFQLRYQNSLILEVSGYAASYYKTGMDYDLVALKQAIGKLDQSYQDVMKYVQNPQALQFGNAHATIANYYLGNEFAISKKTKGFLDFARNFIEFGPTSTSQERQKILEQMTEGHDRTLIELLNAAQADFQQDTIAETQEMMDIQRYISGAIFFIILLEALLIFRPIIKRLASYQSSILTQALEDTLTGLYNRRAFYQQAEKFFETAEIENKPFSVVLCDLDKFKSVNDTYGHDVGDEVLKHFAKTLNAALRPFDIVARMGGEEFAIILANTTPKSAVQILDRFLDVVRAGTCHYTVDGKKGSLKYTTSVGYVVGHPSKILPLDAYLRYADLALYEAKEGGRNRHVRYLPKRPGPEPEPAQEQNTINESDDASGDETEEHGKFRKADISVDNEDAQDTEGTEDPENIEDIEDAGHDSSEDQAAEEHNDDNDDDVDTERESVSS